MGLNAYIAKQFGEPRGFGGRIVTAIMNNQNRPMYMETEQLLSLSSADTVLDIGCGNGYVLNGLAHRNSCDFIGIDISESIIKSASRRNRRFLKKGTMRFSCQNADSMSFADATFDKAYTINTVYFWDDLEGAMKEIRRVMKSRGLFVNTLYTNKTLDRFSHTQFGYKRFEPEQIAQASEQAGFAAEIVPIINGTAYCVVCSSRE